MDNYKKIIDYLTECIKSDRLSHAYIFYGPDEAAKKNISLKFADLILNTGYKFHPDLMLISENDNEEQSINTIRQLRKFMILSPYSGKYKIAIVERAEKLNIYAQNALLKIFEEAPHKSIIILCAKTIDSIPETIASRGVKFPFWRKNNSEFILDEKVAKVFINILNGDSNNKYQYIEKLDSLKTIEIFRMWLEFLRSKFLFDPNKKLAGILKISQNIYFKLSETNINHKLAYDELILNLWNF